MMEWQYGLGKAIALAAEVHKDQTDKAGAPYMLHCLHVMQHVDQEDEQMMIVAVLHDSVEDIVKARRAWLEHTILTEFGPHVWNSIHCLTHAREEPYEDYILRVKSDYWAESVKIQDLIHNMDPRRIPATQIVDKDYKRWEKYRKALITLLDRTVDSTEPWTMGM